MPEKTLLRGEPMDARLHVEWLQGAIARNLKYDIQGTFIATPTTFEGYKGSISTILPVYLIRKRAS